MSRVKAHNQLFTKYFLRKVMTSNNTTAKVEIYTWKSCGYCLRAMRLLGEKNIIFTEYSIDGDEQARRHMMQRAGGRSSMPQIFINGQGIGGFLELQQLEDTGRLDNMLYDQAVMIKVADKGQP
jgi:glutaredoxin 3